MRTKILTLVAGVLAVTLMGQTAHAQLVSSFALKPNPKFIPCLQRAVGVTPVASAIVSQGELNDDLTIVVFGLKPNLAFDIFTVQNSSLLSNGSVNPGFTNFGLAGTRATWWPTARE
jgi:hypothetical protein